MLSTTMTNVANALILYKCRCQSVIGFLGNGKFSCGKNLFYHRDDLFEQLRFSESVPTGSPDVAFRVWCALGCDFKGKRNDGFKLENVSNVKNKRSRLAAVDETDSG